MTRQETAQLLALISASYPAHLTKPRTPQTAEMMIDIWTDILKEYSNALILKAVKSIIVESTYVPTIAEILEKSRLISGQSQGMTGMEAWGLVRKAIKNGIYNSKSEFDFLPPEVQSAIGTHNSLKEWAQMDQSVLETVIQSQFIKSFVIKQKLAKERESLPSDVKTMITDAAIGMRRIE
jgi:hypothetical protein